MDLVEQERALAGSSSRNGSFGGGGSGFEDGDAPLEFGNIRRQPSHHLDDHSLSLEDVLDLVQDPGGAVVDAVEDGDLEEEFRKELEEEREVHHGDEEVVLADEEDRR